MRGVEALPLVLSSGWAAGVNAYATVLLLGIFGRVGLGDVPDGLEDWWVMGAAAALYAVEFVTDKIPYVDHAGTRCTPPSGRRSAASSAC